MAVRLATRADGEALALLAARDPATTRPFSEADKAQMARQMEDSPGVFARVGEDAVSGDVDALCWVDVNPNEQEVVVLWLLPLERTAMPKLLGPFKAAMLAAEAAWPVSRGWLVYAIFPANPIDSLQAQIIAATWKSAFGAKVYSPSNLAQSNTFELANRTHLRSVSRYMGTGSWLIWLPTAGQAYDKVRLWP